MGREGQGRMCAQVGGSTRKGRTVRTKIVERWRDIFLRRSLKVSGSSNKLKGKDKKR